MPSQQDLVFNHDLLLNDGDIALARRQYPEVVDFLDWPALRQVFVPHEEVANHQKSVSRRRGMWGIGLGLVALWLAAFEPRLRDLHAPLQVFWVVAALVLVFGIVGILLGSQILRGKTKRDWAAPQGCHGKTAAASLSVFGTESG